MRIARSMRRFPKGVRSTNPPPFADERVSKHGVNMHLSDFFETVYLPRKLFGRSPQTARLIRYSIDSFEKTLKRKPVIDDLCDDNIRRHMMRVIADGKSVATANKDRAQLCAVWRFAFLLRYIDHQPTVQQLPQPERVPRAWEQHEVQSLLDACGRLKGKVGQIPARYWWSSLIETCLDTGERIGAVSSARWDWLSGRWLLVPAEFRKGGKRDRQYRLNASTVCAITKMRTYTEGDAIWPWPYTHTYLWTKFKTILKAAGLPTDRRSSFHRIRRTVASVCHAAGMNAQDVLDHADRRTTRNYLDPRFNRDRQACDVLADFLANPRRDDSGANGRRIG